MHPNPFNSTTTINYIIPTASHVSLELYNTLGQRVLTLFEGQRKAGMYDAVITADDLVSGLYFVRLNVREQRVNRKLLLLR